MKYLEDKDCWITTFTGKKIHLITPLEEEIDILDIAHALAMTCRFAGHCTAYYSVAEHSIRVMNEVSHIYRLQALLHDAAEAYILDVPRPFKEWFPFYKVCETNLTNVIFKKYNVHADIESDKIVKLADNRILATEGRDIMLSTDGWGLDYMPCKDKIIRI